MPLKGATAERRVDSDKFPMTFHGMPQQWYAELLHTFFTKCVIDLSPMDGKFAWSCLQSRVGYIAFAFTDDHASHLFARLKELLKTELANPESKLFNSAYCKAVNNEVTPTKPPAPKRKARVTKKAADDAESAPGAEPPQKRRRRAAATKPARATTAGGAPPPPPEEEEAASAAASEASDNLWDPEAEDSANEK
jgi:hypothetical protein